MPKVDLFYLKSTKELYAYSTNEKLVSKFKKERNMKLFYHNREKIPEVAFKAFMSKHKKAETVVIEKTVVVHDTLYVQQIAQIEENFNAAKFKQGKSELSVEAQFILHDLAKVLAQNPDLKLRVEGHTSAEGDAMVNQKLSEARAQAAITFLIEHEGIDASRLEAVGFGSSKLKDAENPMSEVNRRTEFKIIK